MSADRWGYEENPLAPPDPTITIQPETGVPPVPPQTHAERRVEKCPVPGCEEMLTQYQLGPHLKRHRNRRDPGTPPPKASTQAKAARKAKAAKNPKLTCPVPDCGQVIHRNALGSHLRGHRNAGDPGTPPLATPPAKAKATKAKRAPTDKTPRPTPKAKPRLTDPEQVAEGVIALLYPNGIPTDRLREVTAWVTATDRLAAAAFADQAESP